MNSPGYANPPRPRWWRHLYVQLVLLSACATAIAIGLYAWQVTSRQSSQVLEGMQARSTVLARSIGKQGQRHLARGDNAKLEELLLRAPWFTDLRAIHIVDRAGRVVAAAIRDADGAGPVALQGAAAISPPVRQEQTGQLTDEYLDAWEPIAGGVMGWVRLRYSLHRLSAARRELWQTALVVGLAAFGVSVLLLMLLLRPPLRGIANATAFAGRLGQTYGERLPLVGTSAEVQQLSEALNAAAQRLHETSKSLNDIKSALDAHAIVSVTDSSGNITYVNDRFCQISQYARAELIGRTCDLLDPAQRESSEHDAMLQTIRNGKIWRGELQSYAKDGSPYWVDTTIVPFSDEDGSLYQFITIQTEITARKQAEDELRHHREDLEDRVGQRTAELNKVVQALEIEVAERKRAQGVLREATELAEAANRAKSEFLANMSHELRTPLNAIIGFTELLATEPDEVMGPEHKEKLTLVLDSAWHLLDLINEVLELSKVEAGEVDLEVAQFDLADLLDKLTTMFREKAIRHSIKLSSEVAGDCAVVRADQRKVKQILFNLISNALKFTPDGGEVGVRAGHIGLGDVPVLCTQLRAQAPDRCLELVVSDTGIGIEERHHVQVFEPFQQVDGSFTRQHGGAGLGLNLSKRLAELHGGCIWLASKPGQGSAFHVLLPFLPPLSDDTGDQQDQESVGTV